MEEVQVTEGEIVEVDIITEEGAAGDGVFQAEDLSILKRNQNPRALIIDTLTSGRTQIPGDRADRAFLSEMLKDMDSEVHSRTRVKVAARVEAGAANLADIVGRAMADFRVGMENAVPPSQETLTKVPSHVPPVHLVPGHLDKGSIPIKMDDLVGSKND